MLALNANQQSQRHLERARRIHRLLGIDAGLIVPFGFWKLPSAIVTVTATSITEFCAVVFGM
jgi:hypothetical protein